SPQENIIQRSRLHHDLLVLSRHIPGRGVGGADGGDLFGDIDAYGAPGNAATAADAAGAAELIDPGGQLVGEPLAITCPMRGAHAASVHVGVPHREAGVPAAPPRGLFPGEVGGVLNRGAEAGGTDQGAVGAGQAAPGDVVPARVLEVAVEKLFDPSSV